MNKAVREHFSKLGKKGGKAFVKKYGKERMRELGKIAAKKRWAREHIRKELEKLKKVDQAD